MAVHPQPHNEAWKVVTYTGEVLGTYNNGRDAIRDARMLRRNRFAKGCQAVRA